MEKMQKITTSSPEWKKEIKENRNEYKSSTIIGDFLEKYPEICEENWKLNSEFLDENYNKFNETIERIQELPKEDMCTYLGLAYKDNEPLYLKHTDGKKFEEIYTDLLAKESASAFNSTEVSKYKNLNDFKESNFFITYLGQEKMRRPERIRTDQFIDIIISAFKASNEKEIETLAQLKEWTNIFYNDLILFAEKNHINLDLEYIKNNIEQVKYVSHLFLKEGISGTYKSHTHEVHGSLFLKDHMQDTHQHELIHAISGRDLFLDNEGVVQQTRLGAEYDLRKTEKGKEDYCHPGARFGWLNEALTEQLNIDVSKFTIKEIEPENTGTNQKGFNEEVTKRPYPSERELFGLLLTSGKEEIDASLFYNALLESDKEGVELTHRKKLIEELQKQYGSASFMVKIDELVSDLGIERTTDIFRRKGKKGVISKWNDRNLKYNTDEHLRQLLEIKSKEEIVDIFTQEGQEGIKKKWEELIGSKKTQ